MRAQPSLRNIADFIVSLPEPRGGLYDEWIKLRARDYFENEDSISRRTGEILMKRISQGTRVGSAFEAFETLLNVELPSVAVTAARKVDALVRAEARKRHALLIAVYHRFANFALKGLTVCALVTLAIVTSAGGLNPWIEHYYLWALLGTVGVSWLVVNIAGHSFPLRLGAKGLLDLLLGKVVSLGLMVAVMIQGWLKLPELLAAIR